jgi:hypothetical protein
MTRRDRLVELACLWQEIRADRPPLGRSRVDGQLPISLYRDPTQGAGIGTRPGQDPGAPTTVR